MTRKTKIAALIFISVFMASGCASVVSRDTLRGVDKTLSPATVQAASDAEVYNGRRVVWGGLILGLNHKKNSTIVEVFSTPLDSAYMPTGTVFEGSRSARFLIESPGFLDEVIYSKGSGITVVGIVEGVRKRAIGEMDYPYPVVTPVEIHLFDMTVKEYPDTYPSPYMWGYSYYPYDPYWSYGAPYRYYYPYPY